MTKLILRPAAAPKLTEPVEPFAWEPPVQSQAAKPHPDRPLHTPPFHPFPAELMDTYGSRPMDDWAGSTEGARGKGVAGRCKNLGCGKMSLESGVEEHARICAINMSRLGGISANTGGKKGTGNVGVGPRKAGMKNNKRSAIEASPTPSAGETGAPAPKRIKLTTKASMLSGFSAPSSQIITKGESSEPFSTADASMDGCQWLEEFDRLETDKERQARVIAERKEARIMERKRAGAKGFEKPPMDLDRQCGVFDDATQKVCVRKIDCKKHTWRVKALVEGRSRSLDECLLAFSKNNGGAVGEFGEGGGGVGEGGGGERRKGKPDGLGGKGEVEPNGSRAQAGHLESTVDAGLNAAEDTVSTGAKPRKRKPTKAAVEDPTSQHAEEVGSLAIAPERASKTTDPDRDFYDMVLSARTVHQRVFETARARVYGLPPCEAVVSDNKAESADADADGDIDMDAVESTRTSTTAEIVNVFGFLMAPKARAIPNGNIPPPAANSATSKEPKNNKKSWQPKETPRYLPDLAQYKSFGGGSMLGSWHMQRRQESAMEGVMFGLMEKISWRKKAMEGVKMRDA